MYGYLMRNRIIFLNQRVNDQVATQVVASLLALNALDEQEEIKLYINCAAGSPYAVISILDTMRAIAAPVSTVGFGMVGGSAAAILAAGTKGRRFSMPSTRILLQQPMGGLQGSAGGCGRGQGRALRPAGRRVAAMQRTHVARRADECNITATELNRQMRVMYQCVGVARGSTALCTTLTFPPPAPPPVPPPSTPTQVPVPVLWPAGGAGRGGAWPRTASRASCGGSCALLVVRAAF